MKRKEAIAYRRKIEAAAETQSDEAALESIDLFPKWKPDIDVAVDQRLQYDGKLYRVVQAHHTQADWTPDIVPALFVVVSVEAWPEWVQPTGSHDAYNKGDKVTFEGQHYISLIDANVWSPAAYPQGWELHE